MDVNHISRCESDEKICYLITSNRKFGMLDEKGKMIVEPIYDSLYRPCEWLCPAKKAGKWGFVSMIDGKIVVPIEYDKVEGFKDGVQK